MQASRERQKRLLYLDSARGLAALSVMTWHFLVLFIPRENAFLLKNPLHVFYYGESDIIFFFIHSGFILSYAYASKFNKLQSRTYVQFLIERIFRIFPLFLFILLLSFLLQKNVYNYQNQLFFTAHSKNLWSEPVNGKDLLKQAFLIILPESQGNKRLLPQDWTLSVELFVGALLPFLMLSIKRSLWVFVLLFLLFWQFCNTYTFEFGLGIFVFHFREKFKQLWTKLSSINKLLIGCSAFLLYSCLFRFGSLFSPENIAFSYSKDRLLVNGGCVLFFIIAISSNTVQGFLSNRWLIGIGKVCYSLYLWHMLWLILFAAKLYEYIAQVVKNYWLAIGLVFCLYMVSVILLSSLSFKFIEVPFNKLGKQISFKFALSRVFNSKRAY